MKHLLLGLAAYVPGLNQRVVNRGTGGTNKAAYCYGVWLKHLTMLASHGQATVPATVAELGPGDSVGVGLAALLSGANTYFAMDVQRFATSAGNEKILDELIELFRARAGRPTRGWPDFDEHLDERLFPSHVLTEERLSRSLEPARLKAIREALADGTSRDGTIRFSYQVPWDRVGTAERGTVDLVLSHSVMEHVRELRSTYEACASWLRPGGWMSHQIDFKSHGMARKWNGCWTYSSDLYWKIVAGRRDCWINREPVSVHLREIERAGFDIDLELRSRRDDGVERSALAPAWRDLDESDLTCSGAFVQARR